MKEYTRVCARIDLDAIEYNMDQMHETVGDATKIKMCIRDRICSVHRKAGMNFWSTATVQ